MADHYYSDKPQSEYKESKIRINVWQDSFMLISASGVFSKAELDFATKLLIESTEDAKGEVLDLGCGYGVVGIAIKRKWPSVKITFADINERAVLLTRKNVANLGIAADIVQSDLFSNIHKKFDLILSNPPMAAGRDVCYSLIADSLTCLNKGGLLRIVARHSKGGKALEEKMKDVFGNVKTIAKKGGFRVYESAV